MASKPPAPEVGAALSACIITLNEADRIADCIRSLSCCDEILVVDSHSTDRTREIAASLGARVIERDWPGYRSQKQFAVEAAQHDWVLIIDADERVSAPLREQISQWRAHGFGHYAGFSCNRATEYFGRFLRHGNAYPDRGVRLFDRRRGGLRGYEIHESIGVAGPVRHLSGDLEHFSYRSFSDQQQRLQRYARLMAEAMHAAGRKARYGQLLFNPGWRFFRGYVLRLGCLDGWRGLVHAWMEAQYVREKYLRLFLLRRGWPD